MKNKNLIIVIIFASALIIGSIIYLGLQIANVKYTTSASAVIVESEASKIQKAIDSQVGKKQAEPGSSTVTDYTDDDPYMGKKDAPVTLIEWSDYECPYCAKFFSESLPQIKKNYIDTGKLKFVYRDYPLNFHKNAYPAAVAAECAREQGGDEIYFKYHDLIFINQSALSDSNFKNFAVKIGLKTDKFNKCFDSNKYKEEVTKDFVAGQNVGVGGTPGFLLNGKLIQGAQPYSVFEEAIEKILGN